MSETEIPALADYPPAWTSGYNNLELVIAAEIMKRGIADTGERFYPRDMIQIIKLAREIHAAQALPNGLKEMKDLVERIANDYRDRVVVDEFAKLL